MVGRIALLVLPAAAVAGLVLLLNGLHAGAGVAAASLGLAAVVIGGVLGYLDFACAVRLRQREIAAVRQLV